METQLFSAILEQAKAVEAVILICLCGTLNRCQHVLHLRQFLEKRSAMKKYLYCVVSTACIVATALTSSTPPAQAWGPEYNFGECSIDTGSERQRFNCFIARGGGAGGYFMSIIPSNRGMNGPPLGTYQQDMSLNPRPSIIQWEDGSENVVSGTKFDNTRREDPSWTIWVDRGWAINFEATPMDERRKR